MLITTKFASILDTGTLCTQGHNGGPRTKKLGKTAEPCSHVIVAHFMMISVVFPRRSSWSAAQASELAVQGYQLCTQACGILDLNEARDAFLSSLCEFTLSAVEESSLHASTSSQDVTSPTTAKGEV